MAATTGTAKFVVQGRTVTKDMYLDDTAGNMVRWDSGGGASATSETFWTMPGNGYLVSLAIVTGAAQTRLQLTRNGAPTGDILRHAMHLTTLANRDALMIPIGGGQRVGMIQLA